ncbi:MAG: pyridoxamine 5'-phosphate oxidase family protein [Anaerolineae bacterium]
MTEFAKTSRNRVRRLPERADYDRDTIYSIIDEALICHVGFAVDGQPFVIPTIHARMDDTLILHGAKASRLLKHVQSGAAMCVAVTLLDGLVVARSAFHNSMNFRSVVLFGTGYVIEGEEERLAALAAITDHVVPGRWRDSRPPNRKELNATTVVALPIESATAKLRAGPPGDDDEDYALPIWAGVIPIQQTFGAPEDDPRLTDGVPAPDYITGYRRPKA